MIYVDDYEGKFGRMVMCHMISDTSLDELHEFAARLGLKREWFQNDGRTPHYDVCKQKRERAIVLGATSLPIANRKEWLRIISRARGLKATAET